MHISLYHIKQADANNSLWNTLDKYVVIILYKTPQANKGI